MGDWKRLTFEPMTCGYCRTPMDPQIAKIKRPVPSEAKDLGLYDERRIWRCGKCRSTKDFIESQVFDRCPSCKIQIVTGDYRGNYPALPVKIKIAHDGGSGGDYDHGTTTERCTSCHKCLSCQKPLQTRDILYGYSSWYSHGGVSNVFNESWAYIHSSCREAWERRQADEEKLREQERREKNGLCLKCGKPLGFFQRAFGGKGHKVC